MTNAYYTPPPDLAPAVKARSSDINQIKQGITSAFDKLPPEEALKRGTVNYAVDTGAVANAYVVAMDQSISAYTDGLVVRMRPTRANTGACSINVNGLGAVSIKRNDGADMQAGDIGVNLPVELSYVLASNAFVSGVVVNSQVAQVAAQSAAAVSSAAAAANSASSASSAANLAVERANLGVTVGLRNALINGAFRIDQRYAGTLPAASTGMNVADMWRLFYTSGSAVVTRVASIAGEGFGIRVAGTSLVGGALTQRIESVRTFAGKRVALSFDYQVNSGTNTTSSCQITQNFGTGGAPSSAVAATAVSDTMSGTRRTVVFDVPSIAGKTIGTAGNDYLEVGILAAGTVTITVSDIQCEAGNVSTPFERRPVGLDLALAQRYCAPVSAALAGYTSASTANFYNVTHAVPMRITPTYIPGASANTNVTGSIIQPVNTMVSRLTSVGVATGGFISEASGLLVCEL